MIKFAKKILDLIELTKAKWILRQRKKVKLSKWSPAARAAFLHDFVQFKKGVGR